MAKPKLAPPVQTSPAIVQDESESLRRALLARLEFEELNLQLIGVSSYEGKTSCFIKHPGSSEQMIYTVGDVIGGYRIAKIENQSVSFEREKTQFFLTLGESSGDNQPESMDGDEFPASRDEALASAQPIPSEPAPNGPALGAPAISTDEVVIKAAQDQIKVKTRRYAAAKLIESSPAKIKSAADRFKSLAGSAFACINPMRNGSYTSSFGYRRHPLGGGWRMHKGIDLAGPYGSTVRAAAAGIVSKVLYTPTYGRHIVIKHKNGYETLYGHLSKQSVSTGQFVNAGDEIGREGSTGWSTGPHLHFEVHKNGMAVNPESYLRVRH